MQGSGNAVWNFIRRRRRLFIVKTIFDARTIRSRALISWAIQFRPRQSKNRKGKFFVNFSPAVSNKAGKAMREKARRWKMHLRSDKSLEDLSRMFSPVIRGWINYYGRFYKSALYPTLRQLNRTLVRWATRKFKRLRRHRRRAEYWLGRIAKRQP